MSVVHLKTGTLIGTLNTNTIAFKGIPYAAPPTGPLQWQLPKPAIPWQGDRKADDFGNSCMQARGAPRNVPAGSRAATLSEDCLTLNVWAPQNAQRAPVMVYLHGGGNENGSSAVPYYDGAAFARDGVVLVSLNYRLGKMGFEPHNGLANFGLWDQVAALQWVHDNIAVFGGDPGNVTLFGESAGGQDTYILMTAEPARSLFHKAIVESAGGGWGPPPGLKEAQNNSNGDWGPIIDNKLLKEPPLAAFAACRIARIPLIIGTNNGEGSLLGLEAHSDNVFPNLSKDDLNRLATLYGERVANDDTLARLLFRDGYFAGAARFIAAQVSAAGSPAYLYRFQYVLSALQGRRIAAYHGSEIPFVFDRMPPLRVDDTDARVEHAVHDCWVAFAKTGKPTCAEVPDWPPYAPQNENRWMVFDDHPNARPVDATAALDLLQCRLSGGLPLPVGTCPAK